MGASVKQYFQLLAAVKSAVSSFEWPAKSGKFDYCRCSGAQRKKLRRMVSYTREQGYLKKISKNGKVFLVLTSKGELAMLVDKFNLSREKSWDGKWRALIFDFPEDKHGHGQRDQLRRLLKGTGFKRLQASVFISPYALNREAIKFLKQAGLMDYIRIMKVEEMDDDADLLRSFKLQHPKFSRA